MLRPRKRHQIHTTHEKYIHFWFPLSQILLQIGLDRFREHIYCRLQPPSAHFSLTVLTEEGRAKQKADGGPLLAGEDFIVNETELLASSYLFQLPQSAQLFFWRTTKILRTAETFMVDRQTRVPCGALPGTNCFADKAYEQTSPSEII